MVPIQSVYAIWIEKICIYFLVCCDISSRSFYFLIVSWYFSERDLKKFAVQIILIALSQHKVFGNFEVVTEYFKGVRYSLIQTCYRMLFWHSCFQLRYYYLIKSSCVANCFLKSLLCRYVFCVRVKTRVIKIQLFDPHISRAGWRWSMH